MVTTTDFGPTRCVRRQPAYSSRRRAARSRRRAPSGCRDSPASATPPTAPSRRARGLRSRHAGGIRATSSSTSTTTVTTCWAEPRPGARRASAPRASTAAATRRRSRPCCRRSIPTRAGTIPASARTRCGHPCSGPFLRDGAVLAVAIITDEADCSVQRLQHHGRRRRSWRRPRQRRCRDLARRSAGTPGSSAPAATRPPASTASCVSANKDAAGDVGVSADRRGAAPADRATPACSQELQADREVIMLGVLGVPEVTAHAEAPPHQPTAGGVDGLVYRDWRDPAVSDGRHPARRVGRRGSTRGRQAVRVRHRSRLHRLRRQQRQLTGQAIPPVRIREVCESLDVPDDPATAADETEIRCCIESICGDDFSPRDPLPGRLDPKRRDPGRVKASGQRAPRGAAATVRCPYRGRARGRGRPGLRARIVWITDCGAPTGPTMLGSGGVGGQGTMAMESGARARRPRARGPARRLHGGAGRRRGARGPPPGGVRGPAAGRAGGRAPARGALPDRASPASARSAWRRTTSPTWSTARTAVPISRPSRRRRSRRARWRTMPSRPAAGSATARAARSTRAAPARRRSSCQAVQETSGMYLSYSNTLTYGFFVAGDSGVRAAVVRRIEPRTTEHWVTYNEGKTGSEVDADRPGLVFQPGDAGYGQNRGCMGQWAARCLENSNGYDYQGILRFFYGDDIQILQAQGSCVDSSADGGAARAAPATPAPARWEPAGARPRSTRRRPAFRGRPVRARPGSGRGAPASSGPAVRARPAPAGSVRRCRRATAPTRARPAAAAGRRTTRRGRPGSRSHWSVSA